MTCRAGGSPASAATAAHYGSVSIVTFVAGTEFLRVSGVPFGGYMVAVVALMETPAILSALILAGGGAAGRQGLRGELFREVALNGSVVLLIGAFLVGLLSGDAGMAKLDVFVGPVFQGVLVLFLLDMGLVAARRLSAARSLTLPLIAGLISVPYVTPGADIAGVSQSLCRASDLWPDACTPEIIARATIVLARMERTRRRVADLKSHCLVCGTVGTRPDDTFTVSMMLCLRDVPNIQIMSPLTKQQRRQP